MQRDATERFVVQLPFNDKKPLFGSNYNQALTRLKSLERNFERFSDLKQQYCSFFNENVSLGHMTINYVCDNTGYYLPHHAVFKETSTTTRCRVLFDGSCKSITGVSLNDTLLAGPVIQDDLVSILLRFRKHPIVITADIEKMYRQILVDPDQLNYQKISWRSSADTPCNIHCRIIGLTRPLYYLSWHHSLIRGKLSWQIEYSSWLRLQRVAAYCLRYIQNLRTQSKVFGPLSATELRAAARVLLQQEQAAAFKGTNAVLASVRTSYWPLAGISTVKDILRQCVHYCRDQPAPIQPLMGSFPAARVRPTRPFSTYGLDYCGPFHLVSKHRRGARTTKAYVAVFVCFTTKAVHLELVGDMTAEACLGSLRRMMARRGLVTNIYPDNGTNFVGVIRELKQLARLFNAEDSQHELAANGI